MTDPLTDWLTSWFAYVYLLTDWLTGWLNYRLTCLKAYWPIEWLTDWLTDCVTDRLVNWQSENWLSDWLAHASADLLFNWLHGCHTGEVENEYTIKINFRFHKIRVIWLWVAIKILIDWLTKWLVISETLDWVSKNMLLHLLAPFLKHFISSLIRIKFERTQTHFCEVFTIVVVFVAFKKLPID